MLHPYIRYKNIRTLHAYLFFFFFQDEWQGQDRQGRWVKKRDGRFGRQYMSYTSLIEVVRKKLYIEDSYSKLFFF